MQAEAKPKEPVPQSLGPCLDAIAAAERGFHLPAGLLPAIARVESGRPDPQSGRVQPWPWTINVEGVGYFFPSKEEAIAAVQEFQGRGVRSIDVGCMQINLLHHPNAFPDLDTALDPQANAQYGARFLSALYVQAGSWPIAAAFYHSQTPDLAEEYRHRVMAAWGKPDTAPALAVGAASGPAATVPITQIAYRDFRPEASAYGAFAAEGQAYGAFTTQAPAKSPSRPAPHAVQAHGNRVVRLASAR